MKRYLFAITMVTMLTATSWAQAAHFWCCQSGDKGTSNPCTYHGYSEGSAYFAMQVCPSSSTSWNVVVSTTSQTVTPYIDRMSSPGIGPTYGLCTSQYYGSQSIWTDDSFRPDDCVYISGQGLQMADDNPNYYTVNIPGTEIETCYYGSSQLDVDVVTEVMPDGSTKNRPPYTSEPYINAYYTCGMHHSSHNEHCISSMPGYNCGFGRFLVERPPVRNFVILNTGKTYVGAQGAWQVNDADPGAEVYLNSWVNGNPVSVNLDIGQADIYGQASFTGGTWQNVHIGNWVVQATSGNNQNSVSFAVTATPHDEPPHVPAAPIAFLLGIAGCLSVSGTMFARKR